MTDKQYARGFHPSFIKGALERNRKLSESARAAYNANPKICKWCGASILVRDHEQVAEARIKNFCNQKCNAKYRENNRPVSVPRPRPKIPRKPALLLSMTKGELFARRKNWQSARNTIQKHANDVMTDLKATCCLCGYDRHAEACHLKSVSSFPDETLIVEINSPCNLVAMCPTHHWELDNGFIFFTGGHFPAFLIT